MRAKHIAILSFDADKEAGGSVEALSQKYLNRAHPPLSIMHVKFNGDGNISGYDCIKGSSPPSQDTSNPRDYGAYLLFHNMPAFTDSMVIWGKGMSFKDYGAGLADRFSAAVFDGLRFPRIGKICMVACYVTYGDESITGHFCERLKTICEERGVAQPLVAGWDDFVTVAFPKNPSLKKLEDNNPTRTAENVGRKVSKSRSGWFTLATTNKGALAHKEVFVWNGRGYEKKQLAESGWSDNTDFQSTSDDKVALLN